MSSDLAIKVEGLGKSYHIYDRPQDRLKQPIYSTLRRVLGKTSNPLYRKFWALKNISFEIFKGDTIGIIGINGSGKSTLLQLICGTLNPTEGKISSNGRIAALLELGSGFNPEFTGKENVYLNASLLGLSKTETDKRFKSIVDFAEIGEFIDQPVKHYSSGMMVRLAFAVIAHVDADILVIDEALAVGDAVFTQKCMRFIRGFQLKGTLLFVSHDSNAVNSLCNKALWLSDGHLIGYGKAPDITKEYTNYCIAAQTKDLYILDNKTDKFESGDAKILEVRIAPNEMAIKGGELVSLSIKILFNKAIEESIVGYHFKNRLGQVIFGNISVVGMVVAGEILEVEFKFEMPKLASGDYSVSVSVAEGTEVSNRQLVWHHDVKVYKCIPEEVRYGIFNLPECKKNVLRA